MPLSRVKTCDKCRSSKARCSREFPICSRCARKGIRCTWENHRSHRLRSRQSGHERTQQDKIFTETALPPNIQIYGPSEAEFAKLTEGIWPSSTDDETAAYTNMPSFDTDDSAYTLEVLGLPTQDDLTEDSTIRTDQPSSNKNGDSGNNDLSSPTLVLDEDLSTLYPLERQTDAPMSPSPRKSPQLLKLPTTTFLSEYAQRSPNIITGLEKVGGVPSTPQQFYMMRQRRASTLEAFLIAKSLRGQITSFIQMMTDTKTLPPFIYPPCRYYDELTSCPSAFNMAHDCLPEPLAICHSILQMHAAKTAKTTAFVWRTIKMEQQRLYNEVCSFCSSLIE